MDRPFFSAAIWISAIFVIANLSSHAAVPTPPTLKEAYGPFFAVGAAIPAASLTPDEQKLLQDNFTNVTPESCMKPAPTEPEENTYTFQKADAFVGNAEKNRQKINGHCLVWDNTCPDWFFLDQGKPAGRELVLKRMVDHITTVMTHFKGRIASWDVVNEALANDAEYLKPTRWEKALGDDYIAEAFSAAAKADPQAELYYNDYNIESPVKRAKAVRLIRDLKK